MSKAAVGIIGAYGATGAVVSRILAPVFGQSLFLAGRDAQRLATLAERVGARSQPLDVFNAADLAAFCARCTVIVNCAGPATRLGPRVAQAAADAGCALVDATGDPDLPEQMASRHERAEQAGRCLLLGVGYMPGLSSVLLHLVRARAAQLGELHALRVFVIDRNDWSLGGFEDLVEHLCVRAPQAGVYQQGTFLSQTPLTAWRRQRFPGALGVERMLPIRSEEVAALARETPAATIGVYLPINVRTLSAARLVGVLLGSRPKTAAALMKRLVSLEAKRRGGGGHLFALAEARGGTRSSMISVPAGAHYEVTGAAVAVAARMIAEGQALRSGCQFVADALPIDDYLAALQPFGIHVRNLEPQEQMA